MYNNKPEFIDPDEKNLTYFYTRTKEKKPLEKKEECCQKKFSFGLTGKNARFPLLIFSVVVFGVFFFAFKKMGNKIDPAIKEISGIQWILSGYPGEDKKSFSVQILALNKEKSAKKIFIEKIAVLLLDSKENVISAQNLNQIEMDIDPQGLKNIALDFHLPVLPQKSLVHVYLKERAKFSLEKEF